MKSILGKYWTMKCVSLESAALSHNPESNALLGQALSNSLLYRALASGTSRAWLTVGCGMQWLDSSMYLLTCRWSSLRYCGLFPYKFHYCEYRINSLPVDFPLWMWLFNQRLKKPSRLGLILKTEDQTKKQGWMPGVGGIPEGCFCTNAASSLFPTNLSFCNYLTAFHGIIPSMPLSRHLRIPSTNLSYLPNVACLSSTNAPSLTPRFPSFPLSTLPSPHLSGKMNQNHSEHLLWTNKCSICSSWSPLSMATHEGALQDVFQTD